MPARSAKNNRRRIFTTLFGFFATTFALAGLTLWLTSCRDDSPSKPADGGANANGEAGAGQFPDDSPRALSSDEMSLIVVNAMLPRQLNINQVNGLKYTEDEPHKLIEGRQIFEHIDYVKSPKLRIDRFVQPDGTRIVLVDMSLGTAFALKSSRGYQEGTILPPPTLHDGIGNTYFPVGYWMTDPKEQTEVSFFPADPIRELSRLPALSKARDLNLRVIYRVNAGVTLESLSYGGKSKVTFSLLVEKDSNR